MSQLSEAKKNNDLLWIIEKYNEYIDDDKIDFSEEDFAQFNKLLREKSQKLDQDLERFKNSSPFMNWASEELYSKSEKVTNRKVKEYIENIEDEIRETISTYHAVKTLKGLKPLLQERYEDVDFDPFDMLANGDLDFLFKN